MKAKLLSWIIFLTAMLFGCATPSYTVSYRAVGEHNLAPWLNDGPDGVITAYNHTDTRARLTVSCAGMAAEWVVVVEPHDQASATGQLMAINTRGDACQVDRVEVMTLLGWQDVPRWKWGTHETNYHAEVRR